MKNTTEVTISDQLFLQRAIYNSSILSSITNCIFHSIRLKEPGAAALLIDGYVGNFVLRQLSFNAINGIDHTYGSIACLSPQSKCYATSLCFTSCTATHYSALHLHISGTVSQICCTDPFDSLGETIGLFHNLALLQANLSYANPIKSCIFATSTLEPFHFKYNTFYNISFTGVSAFRFENEELLHVYNHNSNFIKINSITPLGETFLLLKGTIISFANCVFQEITSPFFRHTFSAVLFYNCTTDGDFYIGDTLGCIDHTIGSTITIEPFNPNECVVQKNGTIYLTDIQHERKLYIFNKNYSIDECVFYDISSEENGGAIAIYNILSTSLTATMSNFYSCRTKETGGAFYVYSEGNFFSLTNVCFRKCISSSFSNCGYNSYAGKFNASYCSIIESISGNTTYTLSIDCQKGKFDYLNSSIISNLLSSMLLFISATNCAIENCNYYNITGWGAHLSLIQLGDVAAKNTNFVKFISTANMSAIYLDSKTNSFTKCVFKDITQSQTRPLFSAENELHFTDCTFDLFILNSTYKFNGNCQISASNPTLALFIHQTPCYMLPYTTTSISIIVFAVLFFTATLTLILLFIYLKVSSLRVS